MKRYSTPPAIRKMPVKIIPIRIRTTKIKSSDPIKMLVRMQRNRIAHMLLVGRQMVQPLWKIIWQFLKLNTTNESLNSTSKNNDIEPTICWLIEHFKKKGISLPENLALRRALTQWASESLSTCHFLCLKYIFPPHFRWYTLSVNSSLSTDVREAFPWPPNQEQPPPPSRHSGPATQHYFSPQSWPPNSSWGHILAQLFLLPLPACGGHCGRGRKVDEDHMGSCGSSYRFSLTPVLSDVYLCFSPSGSEVGKTGDTGGDDTKDLGSDMPGVFIPWKLARAVPASTD